MGDSSINLNYNNSLLPEKHNHNSWVGQESDKDEKNNTYIDNCRIILM